MRVVVATAGAVLALVFAGCGGSGSDTDRRGVLSTLRAYSAAEHAGDHAGTCAALTRRLRRERTADGRTSLRRLHVRSAATSCGPVLDALERVTNVAYRKEYRRVFRSSSPEGRRFFARSKRDGARRRRENAADEEELLRTGDRVDVRVDQGTARIGGTGTRLDGIELRNEGGRWRIDDFPPQTATLR